MTRNCTLVIPGLLDLPSAELAPAFAQLGRLPVLERFFARANRQAFSGAGLEAVVFDLFEVERAPELDAPIAATTYVSDAGQPITPGSAWCLRADPVHLVPDRDQLVLMGPEALSLSQSEANRLTTDFNNLYAEDGWRLEACTPSRWYLHLPEDPRMRSTDLSQVRGRAIGDFLPKGPNGKHWHCIMNEVQMLLHTTAVNIERQSAGQLPVSSLWFWGGGKTPEPGPSGWGQLWSNEPLSLGLGRLSSTPAKPMPESASDWLQAVTSQGAHLLVLDGLQQAWQNGGVDAWVQQLRYLEEHWMAPLLLALRRREIEEITLCVCQGHQYSLSRAGLRRWWRRKPALLTYV
ncbi:hypothetical protein JYT26_01100 [Beggiatoa alba]|nr:hypothetical protein [Beggiatoa alba]